MPRLSGGKLGWIALGFGLTGIGLAMTATARWAATNRPHAPAASPLAAAEV